MVVATRINTMEDGGSRIENGKSRSSIIDFSSSICLFWFFRVYCEGIFTTETQRGYAATKSGKSGIHRRGTEYAEIYHFKLSPPRPRVSAVQTPTPPFST